MAGKYQCQRCGMIVDFDSREMRDIVKRSGMLTRLAYGFPVFEEKVLDGIEGCETSTGRHIWKRLR